MAPAPTEVQTDVPELVFAAPLLGLEHLSRFALVQLDPDGPLFTLQSLEDPEVELVVLAPVVGSFGDYAPELDALTLAAVGATRREDVLLLVVVTVGPTLAESTANLLAPVVVHATTGRAAQSVLTGSTYPLRAPLAP